MYFATEIYAYVFAVKKEKEPDVPFNAERQARVHLVPFLTSSVWRGRESNPRPPALNDDALATKLLRRFSVNWWTSCIQIRLYTFVGVYPTQNDHF